MALVPLPEDPAGLLGGYAARFSRKQFDGLVVDPVQAASHHTGVLMARGAEETVVAKKWTKLGQNLRWLALIRASQLIGCEWFTDFGYFDGVTNEDPSKIRAGADWRNSDVYLENHRSRSNAALGLTSQGFRDRREMAALVTERTSGRV